MRMTVDDLLIEARGVLPHRPGPAEALAAQAAGALLVDIRGDDQRRVGGLVPGAIVLPRNSLEWRCDPASQWRHPEINEWARPPCRRYVVILARCQCLLSSAPARRALRSPRRPVRSPLPACRCRVLCWSTVARPLGIGAGARDTPAACCRWGRHRRRTSATRMQRAGAMHPPMWSRRWRSTAGSAT